ncbi:hypothetical protein HPB51_003354 [Rhipicephalus microplus]|uniref:Uncharacterized protein n=1 Tax=Rhipicephalus microplus TaxID=6941 RepID=A0A9J6D3Q3_RHIMP|nr:hypothetical protein HPB51_003354 [Rhipicephalus microplus]
MRPRHADPTPSLNPKSGLRHPLTPHSDVAEEKSPAAGNSARTSVPDKQAPTHLTPPAEQPIPPVNVNCSTELVAPTSQTEAHNVKPYQFSNMSCERNHRESSKTKKGSVSGGGVGLAIANALMLTGMFQWGVRQSAEIESQAGKATHTHVTADSRWAPALVLAVARRWSQVNRRKKKTPASCCHLSAGFSSETNGLEKSKGDAVGDEDAMGSTIAQPMVLQGMYSHKIAGHSFSVAAGGVGAVHRTFKEAPPQKKKELGQARQIGDDVAPNEIQVPKVHCNVTNGKLNYATEP